MGIPAQLIAGRGRAGIALPAAMMALAMVAIIVAAAFRLGTSGGKAVAGRESAARALMLAEEGAAHAVTVLRENLAGRTATQLLIGPDNSPSGTDNGRLLWTQLSGAQQVPIAGKTTTGGSYTVLVVDDPAENDGNPLQDRNERLLVQCVGTTTDGAAATVVVVVRSAPTPGIAIDGGLTISGNPKIKGACGSVHVNGNVVLSGTARVAGQMAAFSRTGSGALQDTLGNPMSVKTGTPALDIPDLDPLANCANAEYRLFYAGGRHWIYQKSTNTAFDLSAGPKFGWEKAADPPNASYKLSGSSAVDGTVCVQGNVIVSGDPGVAGDPVQMSIYASGSVEISGNPFLAPAPGDSAIIVAGGDVKLNGTLSGVSMNYEGFVYAENQCLIDGTPRFGGQLICKNKPQTPDTQNYVDGNFISGDAEIVYNCNGKVAGRRRVVLWSQPVS
jgi:cytoskeletal protein CcmA (bactofilin family)